MRRTLFEASTGPGFAAPEFELRCLTGGLVVEAIILPPDQGQAPTRDGLLLAAEPGPRHPKEAVDTLAPSAGPKAGPGVVPGADPEAGAYHGLRPRDLPGLRRLRVLPGLLLRLGPGRPRVAPGQGLFLQDAADEIHCMVPWFAHCYPRSSYS